MSRKRRRRGGGGYMKRASDALAAVSEDLRAALAAEASRRIAAKVDEAMRCVQIPVVMDDEISRRVAARADELIGVPVPVPAVLSAVDWHPDASFSVDWPTPLDVNTNAAHELGHGDACSCEPCRTAWHARFVESMRIAASVGYVSRNEALQAELAKEMRLWEAMSPAPVEPEPEPAPYARPRRSVRVRGPL